MTAVETSNTESETGLERISDVGTKKQVHSSETVKTNKQTNTKTIVCIAG